MAAYQHPIIAREGWLLISFAAISALAVNIVLSRGASLVFWILLGILLFLFRDPRRMVPAAPLGVVSPVDGHVQKVVAEYDHYLGRDAVSIFLKMNWYGIYSTRSPVEGKVMKKWFQAGTRDISDDTADGACLFAQWIKTDEGDDVIVGTCKSVLKSQPSCFVHAGERVGQGQRCGFLYFAAELKVVLPVHSRINVQPGGKVLAGSDIIATLVHS